MKKIVASILSLVVSTAFAWQPEKPITVLIGFTPGSPNEISFRLLSKYITSNTGATFVINNKGGAGSAIANEHFTKEPANGYNLLVASNPALYATDRLVLPTKKYGLNDYAYGLTYATGPMVIVVKPDDSANSAEDFIKVLTTEKTTIGDSGGGARLVYESLSTYTKHIEDVDHVVRVEYKGPSDVLMAVMGGQIRFGIMPAAAAYQNYQAKKVKIVAVTSNQRLAFLPNIQTISSVYPGFEFVGSWGLVFPKDTPSEIIEWYNKEVIRVLGMKEVQDQLTDMQMVVDKRLLSSKAYYEYMVKEEKRYSTLIDKIISSQK